MKRAVLWVLCTALVCFGVAGAFAAEYSDYAAQYEGHADLCETIMVEKTLTVGESVSFQVETDKDAFVYPLFTYRMMDNTILDTTYSLTVDGEMPFDECSSLKLDSWWKVPEEFAVDRYGNEVSPMPEKVFDWTTQQLTTESALQDDGLGIYLTAGVHEWTITCLEGAFELEKISFFVPEEPAAAEPHPLSGGKTITLEAERADLRSSPSIRSNALFNADLTPYDPSSKKINYIEDDTWEYAGEKLIYSFSVEESGWYGLVLRCRQNGKTDFPVFRSAYIDQVIPSDSFKCFAIDTQKSFANYFVKNSDGTLATVYLEKGEHTLTLMASAEPFASAIDDLNRIADEMSDFGLKVSKITGGNTDTYRDFDLAAYGLDVTTALSGWREELEVIYEQLTAFSQAEEPGELSNLRIAINQLAVLEREPNDLPKKLSLFTEGSASARYYVVELADSLQSGALGLDSICFIGDESLLAEEKSLLEKVGLSVERFIYSFGTQSYEVGQGNGEALQVWMNRPRQVLEILQQMIDSEFTPATGIKVDLSIMPDANKLILANASDETPDVVIGISSGSIFDMAARGLLVDMRDYESFKEVASLFPEGLLIPGCYNDGCYALPETFNFYVLFYRKDILDSIGIQVPQSMEEVLTILPTLQRYGMNYNDFVSNSTGYKGFGITLPYIVQSGGKLFESGNWTTLLDTEEALNGIKRLTDNFIVYGMDYEVSSFYQSFRDGTLPIGTSNMATYMLLLNAAPEISGKWEIALFPGYTDGNGEVQRWTCNSGESSAIFASSEMTEEAWQFLEWYMSTEAQVEFGYRLQATMGNEYLWNSANTEAFRQSSWPTKDKEVILAQLEWSYEPSRVLGMYMVEREVSNAVNAIVQDSENVRTAMDNAVKRINREVKRKAEMYGQNEDEFTVIDIETVREWLK